MTERQSTHYVGDDCPGGHRKEHTLDLPCADTASAENAVQWCRRRDIPAMQTGTTIHVDLGDLDHDTASETVDELSRRYGKEPIHG